MVARSVVLVGVPKLAVIPPNALAIISIVSIVSGFSGLVHVRLVLVYSSVRSVFSQNVEEDTEHH